MQATKIQITPHIRKILLELLLPIYRINSTLELQWLEHLWDHEKLFETSVVRATES